MDWPEPQASLRYYRKQKSVLVLRHVWLVGDTYLLHSGIYLYFAFVSRSGACD